MKLDPALLRETVRKADFTPTWERTTVRGMLETGESGLILTIPGMLVGKEEESREAETAALNLVITGLEQRLVLFKTEAVAALEPGNVVELTGLLFTGGELKGAPEEAVQSVFLLPEEWAPPVE